MFSFDDFSSFGTAINEVNDFEYYGVNFVIVLQYLINFIMLLTTNYEVMIDSRI